MADNENIELGRFRFNVDDVVKGAAEIKEKIDALKEAQKQMTKEGETSSTMFVQNAANIKALNAEYNHHIKAIESSISTTTTQVQETNLLNAALNQEITSIKQARDNNRMLNKLRNETNVTTEEGRAQLKLLNDQIDANNEFIKENADQYLKQKINIGNYASALTGLSPELSSVVGQLQNMIAGLQAQRVALQSSTGALTGASKALNIFKIALASTGIGALVLALGALVSYLTTTQDGIDKVTSVTRPLHAMLQTLIGTLQDIGRVFFDAVTNPRKALSELYDYLKEKVMTQLEAYYNILVGIATFDFKQAKEGFSTLGDEATKAFNKIKEVVTDFGDSMVEAAAKGAEIDRLQKSIEQQEIDIIGLRQRTTSALLEQENIIKNQLATDEERKKAIAESERLTNNLVAAENKIVQEKIKQLEIQQSLNDTSREDLKEMEELRATLAANEDKITQNRRKNLGAIRQLENKSQKEAEEAQAKAIQRQKDILELYTQEQGVRAKTLQEQISLEEDLSKRRKSILETELRSKKISQEKYNAEVFKIDNELAKMRAELAVESAAKELEIYKKELDRKLEANEFLSEEVAKQRQADNANLLEQQIAFEKERLAQGIINQNDFDAAVEEAREENRIANLAIEREREAVAREEAKALREIEFAEELERLEEERATKFEIEQAKAAEQRQLEIDALNEARENGLISEELFLARQAAIDKKYKDLELQRTEILEAQKLQAITQTIGAVASVVDKSSGAGKALALAQALMNTYQGIAAGVKLGFPAAIPAVAAATATGFKAVTNIKKQKLPSLAGGNVSGESGASAPRLSADMSTILGKSANLTQIAASGNSAVQNQIENQAMMNGLSESIEASVEKGAAKGTEQGSQKGIVGLSDNKMVLENSTF